MKIKIGKIKRNRWALGGLSFNLIGALLLAFSIDIVNPCEKYGACIQYGNAVQSIPELNKTIFTLGISLLFIGFLFQMISIWRDKY